MAKATAKAKPKSKSRSKPKPAKKAKPAKEPSPGKLAALALACDVDGLDKQLLLEAYEDGEVAAELYKWLLVAEDFARTAKQRTAAEAGQYTLLETTSLRYDDHRYTTPSAHWEVGLAYLAATDGLPRDLERAKRHLAAAKEHDYPYTLQSPAKIIADARKGLDAGALTTFDGVYDGKRRR